MPRPERSRYTARGAHMVRLQCTDIPKLSSHFIVIFFINNIALVLDKRQAWGAFRLRMKVGQKAIETECAVGNFPDDSVGDEFGLEFSSILHTGTGAPEFFPTESSPYSSLITSMILVHSCCMITESWFLPIIYSTTDPIPIKTWSWIQLHNLGKQTPWTCSEGFYLKHFGSRQGVSSREQRFRFGRYTGHLKSPRFITTTMNVYIYDQSTWKNI